MNLALQLWLAFHGLGFGVGVDIGRPVHTAPPPAPPAIRGVEELDPSQNEHWIFWLLDTSPSEVPRVWREMAADALLSAGRTVGVVLCSMSPDDFSDAACESEPSPEPRYLDYSVHLSTATSDSFNLVSLTLRTAIPSVDIPTVVEPGLFNVQQQVFVEGPRDGRDAFFADQVYPHLAHLPALENWLVGLRAFPELKSPVVIPAGAEESQRDLDRWYERWDEAEGLLVNGRFDEAVRRAEDLLHEKDLPEELRSPLTELRTEALEQFWLAMSQREEGSAQATMEHLAAPVPEDAPVSPQEEATPVPELPKPFDYTFRVRVAPAGESFAGGVDGRLRIFDRGVHFDSESEDEGDWFVPWREIARIERATGLWDVTHPLVVETEDERCHYLTEVRPDRQFGPGDRILDLLREGIERAGF